MTGRVNMFGYVLLAAIMAVLAALWGYLAFEIGGWQYPVGAVLCAAIAVAVVRRGLKENARK
jgi:uncharacterized membrane protein